jgi:hypothetical protein
MSVHHTVSAALATTCLAGSLVPVAWAGKPGDEPSAPKAEQIVIQAADGFDWSDAAIGAAAGLGAAVAAAGGITLARNK